MAEVLVLYQISNEFPPGVGGESNPHVYNAYYMSRKNGITLSTIKQSCRALQSDGYHWRVRIDEKPNTSHSSSGGGGGAGGGGASHASSAGAFSWWDVQDEHARLPVTEATPAELQRMFAPPPVADGGHEGDAVTQEVTKAAKGAMKYMGKAMHAVAGGSAGHGGGREADDDYSQAVRTPVICFKLLDWGKVRRGAGGARGAGGDGGAARGRAGPVRRPGPPPQQPPQRPSRVSAAPVSAGVPRIPQHKQQQQQPQQHQKQPTRPLPKPRPAAARPTPPTADLMGFTTAGPSAAAPPHRARLAQSMPAGIRPGETRAEKLQREYARKQATAQRVWDDIDQRWVEGPVKNGETTRAPASAPAVGRATHGHAGGVHGATAAVKGIALSRTSAVHKSASVQAAVHARVTDMEQSQQQAIRELRSREARKSSEDAAEDVVRRRLEPRLRAWSEEHGKRKQLRALLANLHTILWEGSGWKPLSLADVLDEKKVKRVYHRASRVVHPDKTGHLDAEKRFVAKRVFDALTQAKVEFDEGTAR